LRFLSNQQTHFLQYSNIQSTIQNSSTFCEPRNTDDFVAMAEGVATANDLFLSAAHGLLENVQRLLSTGTVTATISLSISAAEFTLQVRGDVISIACVTSQPHAHGGGWHCHR